MYRAIVYCVAGETNSALFNGLCSRPLNTLHEQSLPTDICAALNDLDARYVIGAYHSLSIEGYWASTVVPVKLHQPYMQAPMISIQPKKLLLSKWTAAKPVAKQKHFLVTKVVAPEHEDGKVEWIYLEAVHSKVTRRMAWIELRDSTQWMRGWV